MRSLPWTVLAVSSVALGGACPRQLTEAPPVDAPDGPCTAGNQPPKAPEPVAPVAGSIDVLIDAFVIDAGAFVDADGDAHRATRYELHRQKSEGLERVWELATDDAALLTRATLDDGVWLDDGALREHEDYVVRVSFRDDSDACNGWSPLSSDVRFRTDDGSTFLFDESQVLAFEIQFPQSTADALNAQALPPGCVQFPRESFEGTFIHGNERFEGVGVRTKGGCGSSRTLDGKASFKVNLEWDDPALEGCPAEERRLFGKQHFTFNNGVQDPTAAHERLGYALYGALGVVAPRAATVQLYVNGALWGVYTHVETFDRRMLKRHFADNGGMMYEGAYWCDLVPENVPPADAPADAFSCFTREFEHDECSDPADVAARDPTDWELLRALTLALRDLENSVAGGGSFYPEIESIMAFDEFLSMWAADTVLSHWDAYSFHIINNYRVYHDPETGLWHMFPWGIDQTFNTDFTPDVDPFSTDALLVRLCLGDVDCATRFVDRLDEATAVFESLDRAAAAAAIHDQLRPLVEADPRREYSVEDWEGRHVQLQDWIAARPARLREYVAAARGQ